MLRPVMKIIDYINEEYWHDLHSFTASDLEELLFQCHDGDMEFYIEMLSASAWYGDESLHIAYYDDNAKCICLVCDVDDEYTDSPRGFAELLHSWQDKVEEYKAKFLKLKELENDN